MIHALLEIAKGKKYICAEIKDILSESILKGKDEVSLIHSLSNREIEIIDMIKKGLSSREIAEEAYISVKTVELHRYNILKKLNLKNSAELVNFMNHNYSLNWFWGTSNLLLRTIRKIYQSQWIGKRLHLPFNLEMKIALINSWGMEKRQHISFPDLPGYASSDVQN